MTDTQAHTNWFCDIISAIGCYLYSNPVIITALIASTVAIWGVLSQRLISRRKATSDLIFSLTNDSDWIAASDQFAKNQQAGNLEDYANPGNTTSTEARKIQLIFNNYENVAIGINRGTLDYKIVKENWRSNLMYHWRHGQPFIIKMRTNSGAQTLWKEFETLQECVKSNKKPSLKVRAKNLFF